jgi:hypothetical protein
VQRLADHHADLLAFLDRSNIGYAIRNRTISAALTLMVNTGMLALLACPKTLNYMETNMTGS